MSSHALIGLGSNLGDRAAMLEGALAALAATPGVRIGRVSSFRETDPVGGPPGQGPYLNAAAALETTLDPPELLRVLQAIEDRFGRVRTVPLGRADARPRFAPLRRPDHRLARTDRPPSPARRAPVRPGAAGRDRPGSRRTRDRADDVRVAGRAGTGLHLGRFTLTRCQACGVVATRRKAGPTPRDRSAEGVFRGEGEPRERKAVRSPHDWVAHTAEAEGEPPHPPFGHLLPVGEKGAVDACAERETHGGARKRSPSPRRGEAGVRGPRAYATQL